ncbi:MAG: NAD(P)H-hydrate dehydratase [Rhodobiaceae bacterium]|nr:NAD(P)H-hydrate dehydratase [Rhodobiaceae bacterium]MCC0056952.1 NAD(P)H-hydrate dehydratase [Rhodobiaceae bacterium]
MGRADMLAVEKGVPSIDLMERAGAAVAEAVLGLSRAQPVSIVCGPGNNGGDGFVAARLLRDAGVAVDLYLLGDLASLKGDARINAERYDGPVLPFSKAPGKGGVIVDALFGAGLARDIDGATAAAVRRINSSGRPIVAVDIPSGVDGETGIERGVAVKADRTVTFFRRKPGHLLLPGRIYCGETTLADIGIPAAVLAETGSPLWRNGPELWARDYAAPAPQGHKYDRGHAMVISGPRHRTGAARLAAMAALRAGAGLVTLAGSPQAVDLMAAHVTEIMLAPIAEDRDLTALLDDSRRNAWLVGPGFGLGETAAETILKLFGAARHLVLDADALTAFADKPTKLFNAISRHKANVVLTPHEGEFARLFPDIDSPSKVARARAAAVRSGAVVILKGGDTVIAAPDGRAAIECAAPPWLATAGSGDVLAGIVVALLAQGMDAFAAAAMAVWLHGQAGLSAGPALIAGDIVSNLTVPIAEIITSRTVR